MKTWRVTSDDTAAGLAKWADGLNEAFVQLEPVSTSRDGFFGQIRQVSTPDVNVSVVTSNGHEIRRLRHHIRQRSADITFVNILSRGRSQVNQGAVYEAAPMDVSIVDTRRPYAIRQEAAFELASIAVPSDWIASGTAAFHPLSLTEAGRELSSVFWGLARMVLAASPDRADVTAAVAQQIRHSLTLLPQMSDTLPERRTTIEVLCSYIQRHHAQPHLGASRLAAHFGISVRRLHQLFEPTGQSVSEFINEVRLTAAAQRLSEARPQTQSISDIAWQVGYNDPSYFTRRFKRRFGCAPRQYLRTSQNGPIARLS